MGGMQEKIHKTLLMTGENLLNFVYIMKEICLMKCNIGRLCHIVHGFSSFLVYYTNQIDRFPIKLCNFNYSKLSL